MYAATTCSNVDLRFDGSLESGEIESVMFSGPIAPATKRGLFGVSALYFSVARFATRAASTLSSYARDARS